MTRRERFGWFVVAVSVFGVMIAALGGDSDRVIGWTMAYAGGWVACTVVTR